jgi:hypothetical protein
MTCCSGLEESLLFDPPHERSATEAEPALVRGVQAAI